ncbi:hypothetical protein [Ferrimonas lipolytica]|uniref:Uncharacterized protein n=1 Tax=Ferrimonas lipolytica TaxID=2724191 RepID=A0A6H1UGB1_9GAMM|nr:hypothetical protein [Ferrimonas lipolytica]QIZ78121.1 hypothetical protein HER31_15160 [Ferrimonas lipolytica]
MYRAQVISGSVMVLTCGMGIMLLPDFPLGAFFSFFAGGVLLWVTLGGLSGR